MANLTTKEKDLKYIMHTYGRYDVALKSAKGVTAYDENGKKYIDVSSGIGVNSLGYCNDGWVEAVSKQAGTIQHMSNYFYCSGHLPGNSFKRTIGLHDGLDVLSEKSA